MRIDRQMKVTVGRAGSARPTNRSDAVSKMLSRELIQRLLPDLPGTQQAGLVSTFWLDAVADQLSAQDWLSLRDEPLTTGAKLSEYVVDSHDQQTTEGREQ